MIATIIVLSLLLVIAIGVIVLLLRSPKGSDARDLLKQKKDLELAMSLQKQEFDRRITEEHNKRVKAEIKIKELEVEIEDTLNKANNITNGDVDMSGLK